MPVCWYFFLQLFGSNKFSLDSAAPISADCTRFEGISILHTSDSLTSAQINHFNRVSFGATKRSIPLLTDPADFFACMNITSDLLLVDDLGIRGYYTMSREGVDRLLTELDILVIQRGYGNGSSR